MRVVVRLFSFLTLLQLLLVSILPAQTHHIDSLKSSLGKLSGDSRFPALFAIANELEGILPAQALEYGTEALEIAVRTGDKKSQATLLASAAFCRASLGDFSQSLQDGYASLALSEQLGDKILIASARSTLGITYVYVGQFSKALECHLEALRLREELGLDDAATRTMNNIGIVYHNIGQYDKAIEYYKKALARPGAARDTIQMIRFMHNIGFSEQQKGNFEEAMKFHTEALRLAEKTNYVGGMAYSNFTIGSISTDRWSCTGSCHRNRASCRH
ncbi:MAG: tetratricopeptide repeat protein [Ignavibacteriales bacterium]|nr:tetratricopeptide repeat protein [Ignavibacteriales bacterium]